MCDIKATKLVLRLYSTTSFGDDESKSGSLIGQNVTSKHKKTTFLAEDGYVYKGPFSKGSMVFGLVTFRSAWFHLWGDVAYVPQLVVYNETLGEYFIRSANLGLLPSDEKDWIKKDGYHPGDKLLKGRVLLRDDKRSKLHYEEGGVSRAIDVLRAKDFLPEKTWKAILYHFILRFITRSADTGLWNVLIGPDGRPYGIDFEEVRGLEKVMPSTLWDLIFLRKPARIYWDQIRSAMDGGKKEFSTLLQTRVIPHLERVGLLSDGTVYPFLDRARLALSLCV